MTDHKKEAEELARPSTNYYNGGQTVTESYPSEKKLAAAQVHATLYLAEQQRITNVLLFQSVAFQADFSGFDNQKYQEIKGALGL